jgi:hypothetical protein
MATTAPRPAPGAQEHRSGIVTFAGVMLLIAGAFNLLDGVVALANDDYFHKSELLFGDLTVWGLWWLLCGLVQIGVGYGVLRRRAWGGIFAIAIAGLNAFTQLMFLGAYPAWSIVAIVVDGLIIYAMTTRLDELD